jgi:hypothetical protein
VVNTALRPQPLEVTVHHDAQTAPSLEMKLPSIVISTSRISNETLINAVAGHGRSTDSPVLGRLHDAPGEPRSGLQHATAQGRYVVTLVPPQEAPAINRIHAWQVKVAAADGKPVTAAQIAVDGGMPQHGHGLPTQPLVRRQVADGTYLIEGMKFSMTGWWEVKLAVDAPQGPDKVTFNVVVSDAAASRQ